LAVKRKVGYLPEDAPAYPEMTVEEFLAFIAETRGFRGDARKAIVVPSPARGDSLTCRRSS